MTFLQGPWHVAYLRLFPRSFAHTLPYSLANVSKQTKICNHQLRPNLQRCPPPAVTAADFLGISWCLCVWSRYQHQIWAGDSKSWRATFQTCSLLRISAQEEKRSSVAERTTDWSNAVESTVIPWTWMYTKLLGGLEPAHSQHQRWTGWRTWPPI